MITNSQLKALEKKIDSATLKAGVGYNIRRNVGGTVLDIKPSQGNSSEVYPFQCITPIAFTGTGDPPSNQGLKFKVRNGIVIGPDGSNKMADNRNSEFTCPANNTDGYFAWLKCSLIEVDEGNVVLSAVTIETGTSIPNPAQDAFPEDVYIPLFFVTSTADSINVVNPFVKSSIKLNVTVENITCNRITRKVNFYGV